MSNSSLELYEITETMYWLKILKCCEPKYSLLFGACSQKCVQFLLFLIRSLFGSRSRLFDGIPKVDDFTTLVDGVVYNFLDDGTLSEDTE